MEKIEEKERKANELHARDAELLTFAVERLQSILSEKNVTETTVKMLDDTLRELDTLRSYHYRLLLRLMKQGFYSDQAS